MQKRLEFRQALAALVKRFPELKNGRMNNADLVELDDKEKKTKISNRPSSKTPATDD